MSELLLKIRGGGVADNALYDAKLILCRGHKRACGTHGYAEQENIRIWASLTDEVAPEQNIARIKAGKTVVTPITAAVSAQVNGKDVVSLFAKVGGVGNHICAIAGVAVDADGAFCRIIATDKIAVELYSVARLDIHVLKIKAGDTPIPAPLILRLAAKDKALGQRTADEEGKDNI